MVCSEWRDRRARRVSGLRRRLIPILRRLKAARARLVDRLWRGRTVHELAVCAIFREEAPFLDEWLTFHHGIGVSQFHLYNNFSTDDYETVLAPWIDRGLVTLKDWPFPVGQLSAYADCIRQQGRACRWIAFIDIDEFLFAPDRADIRPLLRSRGHLSGIEVYQTFFGANGHLVRPDGPLLEYFTDRAPLEIKTTVKTIANPRLVDQVGVHQCTWSAGHACDPEGGSVSWGSIGSISTLRINHYWSRALDDLATKIARGDASTSAKRDPDWHFAFEKTLRGVEDTMIIPLSREIRSR